MTASSHAEPADTHHHHHSHQPGKYQGARIVCTIAALFLISAAFHILCAHEVLYDWAQSQRNEAAVPQVNPGSGNPNRP